MKTLLLVLLLIVQALAATHPKDWTYERGEETGPEKWGELYGDCAKTSNSPIDINQVKQADSEWWLLEGWNNSKHTWSIDNTKYTVKFTLQNGDIATSGGMLKSRYHLVQCHFHWGANNSKGSEHLVNGKSYPLEMHCVHKKESHKDLHAALNSEEKDAIVALGFFFELQEHDNPALNSLLEGVEQAAEAGTVSGHKPGSLITITKQAINGNFYRYMGGLTTPGCNEKVMWTVFKKPIGISEAQMDKFRAIDNGDYGTELYRPVQPLGDRVVTEYTVDSFSLTGASTINSGVSHSTSVLTAFTLITIWLLM